MNIDDVRDAENRYCSLVESIKRSRMPHGDCKSGKRYGGVPRACAACMGMREIDEHVSNYRGREIHPVSLTTPETPK